MTTTADRQAYQEQLRAERAEARRTAAWTKTYDAAKAAGANHADAWRAATAEHGRPTR